jgi:LysR family glycine cleavage system transcriptional activator
LVHDLSVDTDAGFASWDAWLLNVGAAEVDASRGMQVNNSDAVLQAAIDGHGVALARSVMARDDVVSGRLVRLYPGTSLASELAYYIVYRAGCAALPKLVAFRGWLLRQAMAARQI